MSDRDYEKLGGTYQNVWTKGNDGKAVSRSGDRKRPSRPVSRRCDGSVGWKALIAPRIGILDGPRVGERECFIADERKRAIARPQSKMTKVASKWAMRRRCELEGPKSAKDKVNRSTIIALYNRCANRFRSCRSTAT